MEEQPYDGHVRRHFRSVLNVLIHFSFSLTQLVGILAILGLQIALTLTQTCPHGLHMGYWSFPFLLLSPLSIWLVMWRRSADVCLLAMLLHFCSTLFATAIIVMCVLVLTGHLNVLCANTTPGSFHVIFNSAMIGASLFFKLFNYTEVFLLYLLARSADDDDDDDDGNASTLFENSFVKDGSADPNVINVNIWRSWSTVLDDKRRTMDTFFA